MHIVKIGLGIALAALLWSSGAALAEQGDHKACRADAETLCKGVQRGGGRIFKCLQENENKVSAQCKQTMSEARERFEKNHPCAPDAQKFCKGIQPGDGRIAKCLKEHGAELSAECKAAAGRMHEGRDDKN